MYLELFGNGGLYSINAERFLSERVAARIGVGSWATDRLGAGERSIITVPVMVNSLLGRGNSRLEAGAGLLLGRSSFSSVWGEESDRNDPIAAVTGVLGYRYLQADGFLFRIGLTPFLDLTHGDDPYPDSGLSLSAGISLGYRF